MNTIQTLWEQMPLQGIRPEQTAETPDKSGGAFTDIFQSAIDAVKETDAEILEDKISQVKIIPLEDINSQVFQKYLNNLKGPQNNYILVSPYTVTPNYTRQTVPRQF